MQQLAGLQCKNILSLQDGDDNYCRQKDADVTLTYKQKHKENETCVTTSIKATRTLKGDDDSIASNDIASCDFLLVLSSSNVYNRHQCFFSPLNFFSD